LSAVKFGDNPSAPVNASPQGSALTYLAVKQVQRQNEDAPLIGAFNLSEVQ